MLRRLLVPVLVVPLLLTAPVPAAGSTGAVATTAGAPVAAQAAVPRGSYDWPLTGRPPVTRPFEAPATRYSAGHRGADLAGAPGAEVLAAGGGTVAFAGRIAGRGVVSVLHPDGLRTTYEPVAATVATGAVVARGQVLGTLDPGHPGCPVAACLHWGVRRGVGDYLDPLRLVGRWSVRLVAVDPA